MAAAHSKLAPSAAHRWMNCPGSVAFTEKFPPSPMSVYALDGTAAAWLAAKCLKKNVLPKKFLGKTVHVFKDGMVHLTRYAQGGKLAHEWKVTSEDVEYLDVYVNYVKSLRKKGDVLQIETRVSAEHFHPAFGGTPDAAVWHPDGDILEVVDLKWGQGVIVEPNDNPQLAIYALGLLLEGLFSVVKLTIVQPRAIHHEGPIRTWRLHANTLSSFGKKLVKAAKATEKKNAPLVAGEWCRFCPATGKCPAQVKQAQQLAALDFSVIDPKKGEGPIAPELLGNKQIANILFHSEALQKWLAAVEKTAKERINAGEEIPGYKMVETTGHRKWMDERIAIKNLRKKGFIETDYLNKSLKSPAQVEKTIPKGGKFKKKSDVEKFVSSLCERPRGATLALESDKRPAYIPSQDEFSDLTETSNDEED